MRENSNNNNNNNNTNMESFYEENGQFVPTATGTPQSNNTMKRPLTLDLNGGGSGKPQAKKQRFNPSISTAPVLSSPDLQMLKLASPELEKFIMSTNPIQTPTPSLVYPTKVTIEQENYAKGFEDALNSLHNGENNSQQQQQQQQQQTSTTSQLQSQLQPQSQQQQQQQPQQQVIVTTTTTAPSSSSTAAAVAAAAPPSSSSSSSSTSGSSTTIGSSVGGQVATAPITTSTGILTTVGMSGGSITYTNLDETYPIAIKDEPQTVPSSPPLSPIDMENQEKIKLERKRQRNRVAASKCRKRKLERISKLEDKVKILKGENTELASVIKQLKEHVFQLKQQVIDHLHTGCNLPVYTSNFFKTEIDINK